MIFQSLQRSKILGSSRCFIVSKPLSLFVPWSYLLRNHIEQLLHISHRICQAVSLPEMVSIPWDAFSKEIVLCSLWNRGKDELANLFHSECFVTKVEMNENDCIYRPGLQIWKAAGNHWVWNGFNLRSGSQPMICLLFVNLYKRERNTESKSFQTGCSWKEPVLEVLRLLFTLEKWGIALMEWKRRGTGLRGVCRVGLTSSLVRTRVDDVLSRGFSQWQRVLEMPRDRQS